MCVLLPFPESDSHGVGTGVDERDEGRLGGGCGGDAVDAGMLPGKGLANLKA